MQVVSIDELKGIGAAYEFVPEKHGRRTKQNQVEVWFLTSEFKFIRGTIEEINEVDIFIITELGERLR